MAYAFYQSSRLHIENEFGALVEFGAALRNERHAVDFASEFGFLFVGIERERVPRFVGNGRINLTALVIKELDVDFGYYHAVFE